MAENRRTCASCGTPNEEDARFCEGCGASLARECATCGVEASATARFCRGCGAALDGQLVHDIPAAGPARKTVTVMFADLAGSTTFEENVDAETAREVIGRYHALLRSTAERHRAGMTKYIGDGFMAVWGVPEIGPDDAAHAVDTAVELQERFVDLAAQVAEAHGAELALRVAVNTGEVVVGAGDADLVGDALNVGARLEAKCPRGHVVVGEETWRATRGRYGYESLGQVQVKGRSAPVAVYRWLGRQSEAADAAPFVGRAEEVRRLQAVLDDATATRASRLVTVIGDPGVGKSRLAAEFVAAQGDTCVIEVRCAAEKTVALGPIVEVLRGRDLENDVPAAVPERDRLLRDLNGLTEGVANSVEENFWALRRFVEVLASSAPILLVLDDIQWAGTLLLDFIEHLVEWVQDVPVLVLALARPELREIRPDLVTVSRWVSEAVPLSGLDARATAELAANVLGAAGLPDELLRRLPSSTGGNPLFVRELIGMLAHDGVLVEQPTGWRLTIDVDAIAIPPTIHALLASRLERLDATDRRVLEIASVVGTDFSVGMVRALAGTGADGVKRSLDRLRGLELAQPSGAYVGDEPVWRFHHVLIRDVAYRRLLKSDRADVHERLADWVSAGGASAAFDSDELIARHLEAAHTYRVELGTLGEHTEDLALRSARHYVASARRALDRDELVSAGTQAARGAALANAAPAVHAELLLVGCEAFLSAGDVAAGAPLVDELERISDDALEPWATCYRCQLIVYTAPERLLEVDARLVGAIDEFARRTDAAGLAKAHRVRASARFRLGRVGDAEVDLFEALIAARQSGDHRQITAALGAAPGAALWGPSPVPKAGGRCLDVVRMQRMTTAAPSLEATSMRHLAVLELLRGRPDKARTMLADARQIVADLGLRHGLMETELFAGIIESMEGDSVAAEPHFRTALEGLDALGVGADAGLAAALLARSVLAQRRIDEADRHAAESERLAGRNLKTAIAWRAVRAEILSAQGQHDAAVAIARQAVSVAAGTDLVLDHAEACLALSRVLAAAGDAKGGRGARDDAERLYAAKEVATSFCRVVEPVAPVASPAPTKASTTASRLAVTNQSCEILDSLTNAMRAHDIDATMRHFSDRFVHDDRRRLGGDAVVGLDAMRRAMELLFEQYSRFDLRVLAVRGQRLHLLWNRLSDDQGNETTAFHVNETGEDGRVEHEVHFDEDDFESAYRELERRFYAGEGAASAEAGIVATELIIALNRGEFDRAFGELSIPEMRFENRSRMPIPDRSTAEMRAGSQDFRAMAASWRTWGASVCWLSPTWSVARLDRKVVGADGELFEWTWLQASEVRNGRIASVCFFNLEDEDAAFSYAEQRMPSNKSRLAVTNESCEVLVLYNNALNAGDVEGAVRCYADEFMYEDRRRISGDPVRDRDALRAAMARVIDQYIRYEYRVLAVRGRHLALHWSLLSDDDGNETNTLDVAEADDDGRLVYHGRFDEDDFEGAYRELERRYYAGEGAAFANPGAIGTEWQIALNAGDYDRVFGELTTPDLRVEDRSRSAFPIRSAEELRTSFEEFDTMVASARIWLPVICWLSPALGAARFEREATGKDGQQYSWSRFFVFEVCDGRLASMCYFEVEDEEAAFAYAEERVRATAIRLAVTNESCEFLPAFIRTAQAHDVDGTVSFYSDRFVYDDRRRLSGDPVVGRAALRAVIERLFDHYTQFEFRVLAVRGRHLHLLRTRWSDDDGNETTTLLVDETDDDGLIYYYGRFDEDDFESAYRELEHRYYAGEGAKFTEGGTLATDWMITLNQGDFDRLFGELTDPEMRVENRSSSAFGDRSAAEVRTTFEELSAMVDSVRAWHSAMSWLSPSLFVARFEREAVGRDGELYAWTHIHVSEIHGGRFAFACQFEIEDEAAAFAYAEERVRASTSRVAVRNRASATTESGWRAIQAHDTDAVVAVFADQFVYDDRRQLSGDPIADREAMGSAVARMIEQYPHVEWRTLAVRGERLVLDRSRLSDDDGNETVYLHVRGVDDAGRVIYDGRFDGDDFKGAYRELERRYYAGEGAAFAEAGATETEYMIAYNQCDFDRMFNDLTSPGMRFENRSRSVFPDRSAAEFRASVEELNAMVASTQIWNSALVWLSPACCIARNQREAVGRDGERYAWTRLVVVEIRDGRVTSICEFDIDDEDAAFAYAEDRVRSATSRLAVTNRATEKLQELARAWRAHDVEHIIAGSSDQFVYDDRRRLSGAPISGRAELRVAVEQIFNQYSHFEWRTLAVRGNHLTLHSSRWSDEAGNESAHLHVYEIGDDGLLIYEGRFDEDDFERAYSELENRYYAAEGANFAQAGATVVDYMVALNQGDVDRVYGELSDPEMRVENRSRSVLVAPSIGPDEARAINLSLDAIVASMRAWHSAVEWVSPTCCVVLYEREAAGPDGEQYAWTGLAAFEVSHDRIASMCLFEIEDEQAAFAYAEERAQATPSRLAVSNRASRVWETVGQAMRAHDADGAAALFADPFVYDDRWAVGGDPPGEVRKAVERIFEQYSEFEGETLAVRGDKLQLNRSRWSSEAGYETGYLHVTEINDDGLVSYYGRFDEADFEGAYRELDRRYYAGEGSEFAEAGAALTEWTTALNRGDLDRLFNELTHSDMRFEIRSRSAFPDRTAAELRASLEELNTWVASMQSWHSATCWLSPTCCVSRNERTAVGRDGERYMWTQLYVFEVRDGRAYASCEFELDDEAAAFAYAEERVRASASRVAVTNRASRIWDAVGRAMQAHDVDAMARYYAEPLVYDDRRRLSGNPLPDMRTASERVFEQYSQFEGRTLAVRGERLHLGWSRWSNDAGFESAHLHVHEIGDHGRFVYQARFDEDDFEGAYRELDRRYYVGEGAEFARAGAVQTEWLVALNCGDLDRLFGELTAPEMRFEMRSSSAFPDSSVAEGRAAIEDFNATVASAQTWVAAVRWVSPTCCVNRTEREAVGRDGEQYAWTRLSVCEFRDGRMTSECEFEPDDEAAAFAYAKERVRGAEPR